MTQTQKSTNTTNTARFSNVVRSEWIKFRSVRSTLWCLGIFSTLMVGFSALVCGITASQWGKHAEDVLNFDPVTASLAGVTMGSLAIGVLGVLMVTSEYGTGSIRATLAAVPRRGQVLGAKALVLALSVTVVTAVSEVTSFFVGQSLLKTATTKASSLVIGGTTYNIPARPPTASLTGHGVIAALVATLLYIVALSLLTAGLGFLIRHTAGAISAFVGILFPLYLLIVLLPSGFKDRVEKFLPLQIQQTVVASKPLVGTSALTNWQGIAVMGIYAAVLLGAGLFLLERRDA
jgi:ABC-type transport system involved in multi-copper enzyme maturation permease subunit